jgi:peptide-methionine (R)-S-oxide reductase
MNLSDQEWKTKLTREQYEILRNKGTEEAFSGELLHNQSDGTYRCVACGAELFSSEHKFDSGSGWPSFYDIKNAKTIKLREDHSHGMNRVEVQCANCGGHLGHVFNDAPAQPTGMRFCINSCALNFEPEK